MKTRVVLKNLGRQRAYGLCYKEKGLIVVDPRLDSLSFCDTLIHELLHAHFPTVTEEHVAMVATDIAGKLRRFGYRRIME